MSDLFLYAPLKRGYRNVWNGNIADWKFVIFTITC